MSGIILRWGVPALLTVVGGTALALTTTTGTMTEVLAAKAQATLMDEDFGWTSVSFDSRDATLRGVVADQAAAEAAAARVLSVHGVRSVRAEMIVADVARPFPFTATVTDGEVSLSGGIPDESLRTELGSRAAVDAGGLQLMAGAPPRSQWQPAADYSLELLEHLDQGEVTLSDLDLTIRGRAKSGESLETLNRLAGEPAEGVTVAELEVAPPLASPFTWRANFDGQRVVLSGFSPSEDVIDQLTVAAGSYPLSTSLRLASGEPDEFEATTRTLLENLVLLEDGTAEITDRMAVLSGSPPDVATAERVRSAMTRIGAEFDLAPPRVAAYTFLAERRGGTLELSGHVPDDALRQRLLSLEAVEGTGLELARGAPERFESAIDYGLDLLSRMSEGRFAIEGTSLSISGRAATLADFDDVETALSLGAPQGLILAHTDIRPPLANPFTWSAVKDETGDVVLSGYVPSKAARTRLQTAALEVESDTTIVADGAPQDFEAEAGTALGLLQLLETGEIAYDGANWSMTGAVTTFDAALEVDQAYAASGLREAGWAFEVDAPPPPEPPAPPLVEPYVWSAEKAASGKVALSGHVPTEELKTGLRAGAGAGVTDETELGSGAPETFATSARAGLNALIALDQGQVGFDGTRWSLTGEVASLDERLQVEQSLEAAVDTSTWEIAIQALDAPPVVAPYVWSAEKSADGGLTLAGYVATDELKQFIAVRAGDEAQDLTEVASGEPAGFVADVLAGLEALGHLTEGTVRLDEGIWTLSGVPQTAEEADLAVAALGTTDEARWVKDLVAPLGTMAPDAEEASAPAVVRDFTFAVTKPLDGAIILEGAIPNAGAGSYLGLVADDVPTDKLAVAEGLPDDFVPNALAGVRLLGGVASGEFGLEDETWVLTASAETEADREAILGKLAATPVAAAWETRIDLLPPLDACRRKVAAFAGRNAILFQSGSARLADSSNEAIDELAGYLKVCPDAIVHVEGHTDADGADELNLALSVARAETVVEALIERGVAFQRLYAVGYGESLPIADNDTAAGKRANRRIAFTILDEHQ